MVQETAKRFRCVCLSERELITEMKKNYITGEIKSTSETIKPSMFLILGFDSAEVRRSGLIITERDCISGI
jgi:hypothetical protein